MWIQGKFIRTRKSNGSQSVPGLRQSSINHCLSAGLRSFSQPLICFHPIHCDKPRKRRCKGWSAGHASDSISGSLTKGSMFAFNLLSSELLRHSFRAVWVSTDLKRGIANRSETLLDFNSRNPMIHSGRKVKNCDTPHQKGNQ